jgi:hypothetical protein
MPHETMQEMRDLVRFRANETKCPVCGEVDWVEYGNSVVALVHVTITELGTIPTGQIQGAVEMQCNRCGFVRLHAPRENPPRES